MVKPEIAAEQFKREKEEREPIPPGDGGPKPPGGGDGGPEPPPGGDGEPEPPIVERKKRFFGHIEVDALRFFRDAENVEKEIIRHLNTVKGTNVKITIHIEANNDEGFSQDTERTLRENGRTLGFGNVEFE